MTTIVIYPGQKKDRDACMKQRGADIHSWPSCYCCGQSHAAALLLHPTCLRCPVASAAETDRHPTSYRWQCLPVLTLCCLHVCYTPYQVFSATWARQVSRVIYIALQVCVLIHAHRSAAIYLPYKAVYVQCRLSYETWCLFSNMTRTKLFYTKKHRPIPAVHIHK